MVEYPLRPESCECLALYTLVEGMWKPIGDLESHWRFERVEELKYSTLME